MIYRCLFSLVSCVKLDVKCYLCVKFDNDLSCKREDTAHNVCAYKTNLKDQTERCRESQHKDTIGFTPAN